MSTDAALIDELESAIAQREIGHRAKVLQRITDLFVTNSSQLSSEQIALFDDVMTRLVQEIAVTLRAAFGRRLAEMAMAPPGLVRELALDDCIEVAGPILAQFERVTEETLVESATTKSQNHLLAIAQRRYVSEGVTDVLVERGNRQVAASIASNPGAKFSESGYSTLVRRAEADRDLAARIWRRGEIPRQHLLTLFAAASQTVQKELQSINPRRADEVEAIIGCATDELQTASRERSPAYRTAQLHVESLRNSGQLAEPEVLAFARAGQFDETSVALSLMCDLPIGVVERAMAHEKCDRLLVLAKAIGLSFATVKAIVSIRPAAIDRPARDLKEAAASYGRLRPETARKAIHYYRLRERAGLN
jgi:uncharacterized protein (DUF2336 family)